MDREEMIVAYIPLVRRVAGKLRQRLPPQVELDDLVSYGYDGLVRAVDRYDPDQGSFEPFAVRWVKGAMLDGIRALDWAPRSLRRRARQVETAKAELQQRLDRDPTTEEIAECAALTVEQVVSTTTEVHEAKRASLDEVDDPEGMSRHEYIASDTDGLAEAANLSELSRALLEIIETFDAREQLLLVLHYFEHLTLAQIGRILGIPESRASQMHTRLVMVLRRHMQEMVR